MIPNNLLLRSFRTANRLLTTRPRLPPGVISASSQRPGGRHLLAARWPCIASSGLSLSHFSSVAPPPSPPGVPDLERKMTAVEAEIGEVEVKIQDCK